MNQKLLEIVLALRDKLTPGLRGAAGKAKQNLNKIAVAAKNMRQGFAKAVFSVKGLVAALAGMVIIRQVTKWMAESVELANVQEEAIASLNAALAASGNFSQEASDGLQAYATSLQNTLGIGDEVTLEVMGIIATMTKLSAEALPDAARAVIQLSNFAKVDLKNAALLLGKTLISSTNALVRYGVELDASGTKTEKLAQIIEQTTAGMDIAKAKVDTFQGRIMMLGNAWGDLREQVGMYITQSPGVNNIIEVLTDAVIGQTEAIDASRQSSVDLVGEGFRKIVAGGIFVIKTAEGIRIAFNSAALAIDQVAIALLKLDRFMLQHPFLAGLSGPAGQARIAGAILLQGGLGEALRENQIELNAFAVRARELEDALDASAVTLEFYNDMLIAIGDSTGVTSNAIQNVRTPIQGATEDIDKMAGAANGLADALRSVDEAARSLNFEDVFPSGATRPPVTSIAGFTFGEQRREKIRRFQTMQRLGAEFGREGPPITDFGPDPLEPKPDVAGGRISLEQILGLAGAGISGFGQGGAQGALASLLPGIGNLILPGVGGLVGGILGGFLKKKKKPRGDSRTNPVFVHDVVKDNALTELLNLSKSNLIGLSAAGMNNLWASIRVQGQRLGVS